MYTKQQEQLHTQTSAEPADNLKSGNQLQVRKQIEGSPFWAMGNSEDGYHLVIGNHRLTDDSENTIEDVTKYLEENKWTIILQMVCIVAEDKRNNLL